MLHHIQSIVTSLTGKPRQVFLLDGLGALATALLLGLYHLDIKIIRNK